MRWALLKWAGAINYACRAYVKQCDRLNPSPCSVVARHHREDKMSTGRSHLTALQSLSQPVFFCVQQGINSWQITQSDNSFSIQMLFCSAHSIIYFNQIDQLMVTQSLDFMLLVQISFEGFLTSRHRSDAEFDLVRLPNPLAHWSGSENLAKFVQANHLWSWYIRKQFYGSILKQLILRYRLTSKIDLWRVGPWWKPSGGDLYFVPSALPRSSPPI